MGPLAILRSLIRKMGFPSGPFFSWLLPPFWGFKKTWKPENTKNIKNHPENRPNMHVVERMCFQEFVSCVRKSAHLKNATCFSKWPPCILRLCFLPLTGRSKKKKIYIWLRVPVLGFFGKLKWAPGTFEDQWEPISEKASVVCVCGGWPWSVR